jgi:hypothetical protein
MGPTGIASKEMDYGDNTDIIFGHTFGYLIKAYLK